MRHRIKKILLLYPVSKLTMLAVILFLASVSQSSGNEADAYNELQFSDAIGLARQNFGGLRSIAFNYTFTNINRATGGLTPTDVKFAYDVIDRRGRIEERRYDGNDKQLKSLLRTAWNGNKRTHLSQIVQDTSGYGLIDPHNPQSAGSGIIDNVRPDLELILRLFMLDRMTGLPLDRALENGSYRLSKVSSSGEGKKILEFKSAFQIVSIDADSGALVKYLEYDKSNSHHLLVEIENSNFIEIAGMSMPTMMKESIFVDPPIVRTYNVDPKSIQINGLLNEELFTVAFPVGCLVKNELEQTIKRVLPVGSLNSQSGVADQLEFLLDEGERLKGTREKK